jgi:hypothetical protein
MIRVLLPFPKTRVGSRQHLPSGQLSHPAKYRTTGSLQLSHLPFWGNNIVDSVEVCMYGGAASVDRDGARRIFVYLGYVDDSGSDAKCNFQVVAAVLIPDVDFSTLEIGIGLVLPELFDAEHPLPESFEEFHATELFCGRGVFQGIPQEKRFDAIRFILETVANQKLPIMYGAVNRALLEFTPFASAKPLDIAFRGCALGINGWLEGQEGGEMCLLIMDEGADKSAKADIRKAFKQLRPPLRPPNWNSGLQRMHDAMYFGNSKDSIGIQIADLCAYFICQHLMNPSRAETEGFYRMFADQIYHKSVEPSDGDTIWGRK